MHAPLLPSTPPSAAAARERQKRLRLLVAAGAAALAILLLLTVEGWQQSAALTAAGGATSKHALGMPAETAIVEGSGAAASSGGAAGSGWWNLWQGHLADQEARVDTWRERQRAAVVEETSVDEAAAAVDSSSLAGTGTRADAVPGAVDELAAAAAAATRTDPLAAGTGAIGEQPQLLGQARREQQQNDAAAAAAGRVGRLAVLSQG